MSKIKNLKKKWDKYNGKLHRWFLQTFYYGAMPIIIYLGMFKYPRPPMVNFALAKIFSS
ncbi:unnamed protein product [Moneuplotes crassus]|uniref:Uncharacterized protein n=1 Tax=Euplotes crassus TaxID=5936 RepID=A0AAD1Y2T0_EUPCR|nr:unnamed protein product [Moneuplotes crassus]